MYLSHQVSNVKKHKIKLHKDFYDQFIQKASLPASVRNLLKDERGNIESALVLIPLIFLFLISMQLITSIYCRNIQSARVQNEASVKAISGVFEEGDRVVDFSRGYWFNNLHLVVTRKNSAIPTLIPGIKEMLDKKFQTELIGTAVLEEKR